MKRILTAIVLALLITGCGSDAPQNNEGRNQVEACISNGGHAVYTTWEDGSVRAFLGCERIPADPVTP